MQIWIRHQKNLLTPYIMKFWTNIRAALKRGVLALKVPGGHKPEFFRGQQKYFYVHNKYLHILAKFHKDLGMDKEL